MKTAIPIAQFWYDLFVARLTDTKNAFMWPPHRRVGTPARLHRGYRRPVHSIRQAERRLRKGQF